MSNNTTKHNIPSGWQVKTLGDVGRVSMCKRVMKNQTKESGDIPFFKIGTFGREPDAYISNELYQEFKGKYSFPKKGDVLISASGTIGRTVVYDGQAAYYQDSNIIWIANNEDIVINSYLSYLYDKVQWQTASGTIARLYNDNVRRIEVSAPQIPEQMRIVKVLETWDGAIKKLEQTIALKRDVKKGLMQKLLTGELRLPGFSGEWKKYLIGEVFEYIRTYAVSRDNLVDGKFNDGLIGNVHYGDLHSKFSTSIDLDIDEVPQVIDEDFVFQSDDCLRDGDLIMADASEDYEGIAVTVSIHNVKDKKIVGGLHTFVLRDKKGLTTEYYRQFIFKVQDVRRQLRRVANGVSVYGVSKSNISKIPILLPPPDEQGEIAKVLVNAEKEIVILEKKKQKLLDQKKYLLNNLVTGQIRTPENL